MGQVTRTYNGSCDIHDIGRVHTCDFSADLYVPDGKVMTRYENHEENRHDAGDPSISTIYDSHFHLPIGVRIECSIRSGPFGDEYEGALSGYFELFYNDLLELPQEALNAVANAEQRKNLKKGRSSSESCKPCEGKQE